MVERMRGEESLAKCAYTGLGFMGWEGGFRGGGRVRGCGYWDAREIKVLGLDVSTKHTLRYVRPFGRARRCRTHPMMRQPHPPHQLRVHDQDVP